MRDLRMYILVNQDIKIGKGKLAGQVGHAVNILVYKYLKGSQEQREIIEEYMSGEIKKVILKAPQDILEELEKNNAIRVRDKGYTQLEPNTLTCVNLGIFDYDELVSNKSELLSMSLY